MGKPTDKYIRYCMERVRFLQEHGVTPYFVFDGASLPIKRDLHVERRRARDEARAKALQLHGDGHGDQASRLFQKAVMITHEMAYELIKALRAAGVRYVVAPYEADAQLAYLSRKGVVDIVITEDSVRRPSSSSSHSPTHLSSIHLIHLSLTFLTLTSSIHPSPTHPPPKDTIPYGCRRVLFKMDKEGRAQEIESRHLALNDEYEFEGPSSHPPTHPRAYSSSAFNPPPSFSPTYLIQQRIQTAFHPPTHLPYTGWTENMFLDMCLLAGCDYLPNIHGMGVKTAHKLVKSHRTYKRVLQQITAGGAGNLTHPPTHLPTHLPTNWSRTTAPTNASSSKSPAAAQVSPPTHSPTHPTHLCPIQPTHKSTQVEINPSTHPPTYPPHNRRRKKLPHPSQLPRVFRKGPPDLPPPLRLRPRRTTGKPHPPTHPPTHPM